MDDDHGRMEKHAHEDDDHKEEHAHKEDEHAHKDHKDEP